jgi:hypothetical protein
LAAFDAIVIQVQNSFIKTKTQKKYFEFFNIHINHLSLHSMTNMALMWHCKNISNKIIIFIKFWRSLDVFFGSFDCDCTPEDMGHL